ncbi:MAG: hypothetical protein M3O46_00765 [Myxococcota bacterium]|nr:hypothetical protein [Myxococcota bacterium]
MIRDRLLAQLTPGVLAVALQVMIGCTTSASTTGYTPVTGIQITASDIVAGRGCGEQSGQVYKYAAVVSYANDAGVATDAGVGKPFVSGVFDCFADGIFSNLPALDSGLLQGFDVSIYAYDKASFPPALACPPGTAPCPGDDAGAVNQSLAAATWTTTCTASQIQGATSVAACGALQDARPTSRDAAASE